MGKKAWIIFGLMCVIIVGIALVLMIVLVPQVKSSVGLVNEYNAIAKQEYAYSAERVESLKHEYTINSNDVEKGLKTNKYDEGDINPFTPNNQVTIYNEPTINNSSNNSGTLTPDSK